MAEGLRARVLSAAVLAPPVLAALIAGPPFSDVLIVLAAAILAWEWCGLVLARRGLPAWLLVLFAPLFTAGAIFLHPLHLAATAAGGALVCYLLQRIEEKRDAPGLWLAAGIPYLVPACAALLLLRRSEPEGLLFVVFTVLVVWATEAIANHTTTGRWSETSRSTAEPASIGERLTTSAATTNGAPPTTQVLVSSLRSTAK